MTNQFMILLTWLSLLFNFRQKDEFSIIFLKNVKGQASLDIAIENKNLQTAK